MNWIMHLVARFRRRRRVPMSAYRRIHDTREDR